MSTSTRDLSSGELWQHSLERSRRRRVLAEDARKTITRKKHASLAVTAAMAATPVAPSLIASASSGPGRGTLSATQIRHENSDRVLLKKGAVSPSVAQLQRRLKLADDGEEFFIFFFQFLVGDEAVMA